MADAAARQDLLDAIGAAADEMAFAIAALGEAYDHLDDATAERLENGLFRPVQQAYGLTQRTHGGFAARHRLPAREFAPRTAPAAANRGPRATIDNAVEAIAAADAALAELQDSFAPVEYGDQELRAGLESIRQHLTGAVGNARELVRTLGR